MSRVKTQTLKSWWAATPVLMSSHTSPDEQSYQSWWAVISVLMSSHISPDEQSYQSWSAVIPVLMSSHISPDEQSYQSWWTVIQVLMSSHISPDEQSYQSWWAHGSSTLMGITQTWRGGGPLPLCLHLTQNIQLWFGEPDSGGPTDWAPSPLSQPWPKLEELTMNPSWMRNRGFSTQLRRTSGTITGQLRWTWDCSLFRNATVAGCFVCRVSKTLGRQHGGLLVVVDGRLFFSAECRRCLEGSELIFIFHHCKRCSNHTNTTSHSWHSLDPTHRTMWTLVE